MNSDTIEVKHEKRRGVTVVRRQEYVATLIDSDCVLDVLDCWLPCEARVWFNAKPLIRTLSREPPPCAFKIVIALMGYLALPENAYLILLSSLG
jgi:hypothetical protein